ncbi:MAG: flagellar biosynthetic protein FliO [Actinomycetota bacterium]
MTPRAHRARALARAATAAASAALLAPALAAAASRDPESQPIAQGGSSGTGLTGGAGGTLLRMGVGLAVVLLVIGAVWYVLRRIRTSRYPEMDARGTSLIDVLATTPLGPNRNLHVVRVGDGLVVVGATEHSITPVVRLTGDEAEALAKDLLAPDARGAFTPSAGSRRPDARFRAPVTAPDATVLDRLRALTTRR